MDDPAKVLIALSLFGSVAYSIGAIARAAVAPRKTETQIDREPAQPLAEARLARIEQAVDAIALEVERISEGQRFMTRLLSEQTTRLPPNLSQRGLSANTPT